MCIIVLALVQRVWAARKVAEGDGGALEDTVDLVDEVSKYSHFSLKTSSGGDVLRCVLLLLKPPHSVSDGECGQVQVQPQTRSCTTQATTRHAHDS